MFFANRAIARRYRARVLEYLQAIPELAIRRDLRNRLRSDDDTTHYGARFEVLLDGNLRGRGWHLEHHPAMRGVQTHPDFLVTYDHGQFLLEAVLVRDEQVLRAAAQRLREVVDRVDGVPGNVGVFIVPVTPVPHQYPLRRLEAFLRRELQTAVPGMTLWFEDDWNNGRVVTRFVVVQRPAGQHGVAAWMQGGARELTAFERIRDAAAYKAGKYGRIGKPFVIAMWTQTQMPVDEWQIERALYGDQQLVIRVGANQRPETDQRRAMNGFFTATTNGHVSNSHVSAMLFYTERHDDGGGMVVFHNPYARRPLSRRLFADAPQKVRIRRRDGTVDLVPVHWPQGDRPFGIVV
ncbi:MAG TPA: hypothetical protein VK009_14065 [Chloroflexota bacterium]|nr:hypothetical protein [Chloroflexota bacterium]